MNEATELTLATSLRPIRFNNFHVNTALAVIKVQCEVPEATPDLKPALTDKEQKLLCADLVNQLPDLLERAQSATFFKVNNHTALLIGAVKGNGDQQAAGTYRIYNGIGSPETAESTRRLSTESMLAVFRSGGGFASQVPGLSLVAGGICRSHHLG